MSDIDDFDMNELDKLFGSDSGLEQEIKKGKPVTELGRGFLSGIKDIAKDTAINPDFYKSTLKESGFKEYSDMVGVAAKSVKEVSNLYNESVRVLKDPIAELVKNMDKRIPASQSFLKRLSEKTKAVLGIDSEPDTTYKTEEQLQEENVQNTVNNTFAEQEQATVQMAENARFRTTVEQRGFGNRILQSINQGIYGLNAFNSKIAINYQKKSLEIQVRSYLTQRETLALHKRALATIVDQNKALIWNSSLPDIQKIRLSKDNHENQHKMTKYALSKGASLIGNSAIGKRIQESVRKKLIEHLQNAKDTIGEINGGMSMADGMDMAGMSTTQLAGMGLANLVFGGVFPSVEDLAKNLLSKVIKKHIDPSGKIGQFGKKYGKYFSDTEGGMGRGLKNASDWLRPTIDEQLKGGMKTWFKSTMAGILENASVGKLDLNLTKNDNANRLHQAAIFNLGTQKSITTIIPGYLARILKEIQVFRTGKDADLTVFDHDRNQFLSASRHTSMVSNTIKKSMYGKWTNEQLDKVVGSTFGADLSPAASAEIKKMIVRGSLRRELIDGEYLSSDRAQKNVPTELRAEINRAIQSKLTNNLDATNSFVSNISKIKGQIGDPHGYIEDLINAGYHDELIQGKIIRHDGRGGYRINEKKLTDFLTGVTNKQSLRRTNPTVPNTRLHVEAAVKAQQTQSTYTPSNPTINSSTANTVGAAYDVITPAEIEQAHAEANKINMSKTVKSSIKNTAKAYIDAAKAHGIPIPENLPLNNSTIERLVSLAKQRGIKLHTAAASFLNENKDKINIKGIKAKATDTANAYMNTINKNSKEYISSISKFGKETANDLNTRFNTVTDKAREKAKERYAKWSANRSQKPTATDDTAHVTLLKTKDPLDVIVGLLQEHNKDFKEYSDSIIDVHVVGDTEYSELERKSKHIRKRKTWLGNLKEAVVHPFKSTKDALHGGWDAIKNSPKKALETLRSFLPTNILLKFLELPFNFATGIFKGMGLIKDKVKWAASKFHIPAAMKGLMLGAGKLLFNTPLFKNCKQMDVYILNSSGKGIQPEPVLTKIGFGREEYFTAAGKPCKGICDIKGDIFDKDGNLLLSERELKNGIYDKNGKRIVHRSMLNKIVGFGPRVAINTAKRFKDQLMWSAKMVGKGALLAPKALYHIARFGSNVTQGLAKGAISAIRGMGSVAAGGVSALGHVLSPFHFTAAAESATYSKKSYGVLVAILKAIKHIGRIATGKSDIWDHHTPDAADGVEGGLTSELSHPDAQIYAGKWWQHPKKAIAAKYAAYKSSGGIKSLLQKILKHEKSDSSGGWMSELEHGAELLGGGFLLKKLKGLLGVSEKDSLHGGLLKKVGGMLKNGFNKVGNILGNVKNFIFSKGKSLFNAGKNFIKNKFGKVVDTAGENAGEDVAGAAAEDTGIDAAGVAAGDVVAGAGAAAIAVPALITAGVAAVGYGVYRGAENVAHSGFKSNLLKIRVAQYGFQVSGWRSFFEGNKGFDHQVTALKQTEETCTAYVHTDSNGKLSLKLPPQIVKNIMSYFNIQPTQANKALVNNFQIWFNNRFTPAYLANYLAVQAASGSKFVDKIDTSLTTNQKWIYLNILENLVKANFMIYKVKQSPFAGWPATVQYSTVIKYIKEAKSLLKKELSKKRLTKDAIIIKKERKLTESIRALRRAPGTRNAHEGLGGPDQGAAPMGSRPAHMGLESSYQGAATANQKSINFGSVGGPIKSSKTVQQTIAIVKKAANKVGVNAALAATIAGIESNFDATAGAATSSAKGLFQFIDSTWNTYISQYATMFGISGNASPFNPWASSIMGALMMKHTVEAAKSFGFDATPVDIYAGHFLGNGEPGLGVFLKAKPDDIAAKILPLAAQSNSSVFYQNGEWITIANLRKWIAWRLASVSKAYNLGLDIPSIKQPVKKSTTRTAIKKPATTAADIHKKPDTTSKSKPNLSLVKTTPKTPPPTTVSTTNTALVTKKASITPVGFTGPHPSSSHYVHPVPVISANHEDVKQIHGHVKAIHTTLEKSLDVQNKTYDALTTFLKSQNQVNTKPSGSGYSSNDDTTTRNPRARTIPVATSRPVPVPNTAVTIKRKTL